MEAPHPDVAAFLESHQSFHTDEAVWGKTPLLIHACLSRAGALTEVSGPEPEFKSWFEERDALQGLNIEPWTLRFADLALSL